MNGHDPVARYYDRNTLRFLLFGGGTRTLSIHRELWGPGVDTPASAKRYVNALIEQEVRALALDHPTVLDLGCGVGGTLLHLAERFPGGDLHGVTISGRQHALARGFAARRGLSGRCHLHHADFEEMRLDIRADAAIAVEAFAHASRPSRFFEAAAGHLRERGRLILVDDFLARNEADLDARARHHVGLFRSGWRLGSLCTAAACADAARGTGLRLVQDTDLTGLVRPGRPRDRMIARLSPWFERLGLVDIPFFANMIGGNALQAGLREGFLRYRMLTFERSPGG